MMCVIDTLGGVQPKIEHSILLFRKHDEYETHHDKADGIYGTIMIHQPRHLEVDDVKAPMSTLHLQVTRHYPNKSKVLQYSNQGVHYPPP